MAIAGMLPPLVLELRSKAGSVITDLKTVGVEVEKTAAKSDVATSRMEKGFNKVAGAGKILAAGVTAGALIVGVESTKMAADFQSRMNLLVSAAGESPKALKQVSDGVLNLAGATGTSIDQLSEGMYTVEKSGNRGADGLKILKAAAEGAKAENVDLATATNALTSVMMSYHDKSGDAIKVQNELIAGSGLAKTTMQNYAGSLSTVIPVASAAGVSFEQVAGAVATLTQHGTSADEATQELSNTIRNLQAPNQVAQKAMQQLGLDVNDVSTKLGTRGLTGTVDLITNAISTKLGPSGLVAVDAFKKSQSASADLQTMLTKMPKSLSEMSQKYLSGSMSLKEYQKAVKDMGGSSASMGLQFLSLAKQTQGFNNLLQSGQPEAQTFAAYLKQVMGGATGMNTALMLGGENMAYFKKATDEVGNAGKKTGSDISTWSRTQSNLTVQLAQAGQGIAAMGVRIGTVLIPIVSQAIKVGQQWAVFLQKNPPLLIAIASVIGGVLAIAITAWIAKLVIAGVQSVIQFAKMITAGAAWAANQAIQFAQVTARLTTMVAQGTAQFAVWLAKQAATVARAGVLWVQYAAMVVRENGGIIATLGKGIAAGASWLAAQTAQLAKSGAMWVAAKAQMVASLVAENAAMVAQKAVMIAGSVATGIATAAQWAFNAAADANPVMLIVLAIIALIAVIVLLVTHWKEVSAFIMTVWTNVANWFKTVGDAIAKWWNGFWNGIVTFAKTVFMAYINIYIGIFTFLWNALVGIGNAIANWWNGLWNGITSFLSSLWTAEVHGWSDAFNWLYTTLVGIGRSISDWWNGLWTGIAGFVTSVWRGAGNAIIGFLNGVIDMVNDLIHGINTVLDGVKAASGGTISLHIGNIPHLPSFDIGTDRVPGADGAPLTATVHGGEAIVSNDMLAGRKPIPQRVTDAVDQQRSARGQTATTAASQQITVQVQTNATGKQIASAVAWELRRNQ